MDSNNGVLMFYVYIYLNPRKSGTYKYPGIELNHEPFYVGKGKGNRWIPSQHFNGNHSKYLERKIRKIGINNIIVLFLNKLTNNTALRHEIELIASIGRKVIKDGPLLNITIGGETNYFPEITRKKISKTLKNRTIPEEVKEKISKTLKGRVFSKETKQKISISCKKVWTKRKKKL